MVALRPLDNTPEATPERPRKALKKTAGVPINLSGNDENAAQNATISEKVQEERVEYVASKDLEPMSDPEKTVQSLLPRLDSKDWLKVCEALNDARRLAIHHSDSMIPLLDKVVLMLVKAMKNPRSALCKTSIMACTDIFNGLGHLFFSPPVSEVIDTLLLQLLLKASQDKQFVCEEAECALRAMADSCAPLPLLKKLEHYVNHNNLRVRAKAAVSISNCITKLDTEAFKEIGFASLLRIAADSLNDRLPEAREAARNIISSVHSAFSKVSKGNAEDGKSLEESWIEFCSSNLPPIAAQTVEKIVLQRQ